MAQFVNYKKRSFTLPPGCKNLIDALEPSRRATKDTGTSAGFQRPEVKEDRFPAAGAAQIERYVAMLLQSRGEMFTLSVTAQGFEFPVTLYRSRSEATAAIVLVTREAHRAQATRAFFERQGIEILWDYPPSALGASDAACGLVYPLPSEVGRAITLTTKFLRSVYGLSDDAGIDFRNYEMETAA